MEKRESISNGYGWMRFILLPILFAILLNIFSESENRAWMVLYFHIGIGLYFLLYRSRKLKYDSQHLYIIHGKKEKVVPFERIISIKRSRAKVNGSRYWILVYTNEEDVQKKIRFFRSFFNKDFHEKLRMANPSVVIWTHPFFNH